MCTEAVLTPPLLFHGLEKFFRIVCCVLFGVVQCGCRLHKDWLCHRQRKHSIALVPRSLLCSVAQKCCSRKSTSQTVELCGLVLGVGGC
jgi:hypothetical protein